MTAPSRVGTVHLRHTESGYNSTDFGEKSPGQKLSTKKPGRGRTRPGFEGCIVYALLYDFLHFLAAGALAGSLADRVALAIRTAGAHVLACCGEGPGVFPSGCGKHGAVSFDLGDLCLDHGFAAGAVARIRGHCFTGT